MCDVKVQTVYTKRSLCKGTGKDLEAIVACFTIFTQKLLGEIINTVCICMMMSIINRIRFKKGDKG
jgi:hypothetical protein